MTSESERPSMTQTENSSNAAMKTRKLDVALRAVIGPPPWSKSIQKGDRVTIEWPKEMRDLEAKDRQKNLRPIPASRLKG